MKQHITHSKPMLSSIEVDAVGQVLRSGLLIGGPVKSQFCEAISALLEKNGSVHLFASGRMAIRAALEALQLPARSGIVVQSYVCDAVIWAIVSAGHRPVLCDVGDGWVADRENVESVIDRTCGAIILAPPYGFAQSAGKFRDFGLPIVHDLCQASVRILSVMSRDDLGDIATMSFHPTKYLCAGGGGAVADLSGRFGETLHLLESKHGDPAPFTELQAAIGKAQLVRLEEMKQRREILANLYLSRAAEKVKRRFLSQVDVNAGDMFRLPLDVVRRDAEDFFGDFAKVGITARHGVDQLAHRLMDQDDKSFPNSVRAYRQTLSLPFYPALTDEEANRVADAIVAIL